MSFGYYVAKLDRLMCEYYMKDDDIGQHAFNVSQLKYNVERQQIYDIVMDKFEIDISHIKTQKDVIALVRKSKLMKIK